ncbi:hypothetical protein [Parasphingorhabdus sp.]|uniref:hypothetical protein n=1 Tax=Parasphingorhabdus sp. TaxID=2709688 RepID=UPI003265C5B7
MKLLLALLLPLGLLAACTTTALPLEPWTDNFNQSRDPAIVTEARGFIIQRQGCDHFRGEPGYDDERQKFLNAQTKKLCTGTDEELTRLREKYTNHAATIKALAEFEDCIEYESPCSTVRREN